MKMDLAWCLLGTMGCRRSSPRPTRVAEGLQMAKLGGEEDEKARARAQGEGKPVRGVGGNSVSVANAASKGFFLPGFPVDGLSTGTCPHNTRKMQNFPRRPA
jgi:hypothetical protein